VPMRRFLRANRPLTRRAYLGVLTAFWLYAFAWAVAVFLVVHNWQKLGGVSASLLSVVLLAVTPTLGDLTRSYAAYRQWWDKQHQSTECAKEGQSEQNR